jgi:hypothetical protein
VRKAIIYNFAFCAAGDEGEKGRRELLIQF